MLCLSLYTYIFLSIHLEELGFSMANNGGIAAGAVGRKRPKFRSLHKILEETSGRRKWAELEIDCLIHVLGKVGMESLLLSVPLVCKSWHKATLDPMCWQTLSFPEFLPLQQPRRAFEFEPFYYKFANDVNAFSITAFVRMVVARSHGKAVEIKLPGFIDEETLRYVSDTCPEIRVLSLTGDVVLFNYSRVVKELVGKWKMLEELHLGGNLKKIFTFRGELDRKTKYKFFPMGSDCSGENIIEDIVKQIAIHCKHFVGLRIAHAYILDAVNVVKSLRNLKYLGFEESDVEEESLVKIVKGCKQLEVLELSNSGVLESFIGSEIGEEIANLAKDYGVEFLWHDGGVEDGEDYYSRDAQIKSRKLLLDRGVTARMSTGGVAPRKQLRTK